MNKVIEIPRMSVKLVKSLKLHNDKVWSIDFEPKRGLLATGSTDKAIKVVQLRNGKENLLDVLDDTVHKKAVRSVAWRPHSDLLAAGSFDSTISIWTQGDMDVDEPSTLEMDLLAIIEGHENEVKGVSWSHDGYLLATCSRDKSVWIWETDEAGEEYECVSVLQEHSQDVKHVVWHTKLNLLASSSYDDTVRIWKDFDDDWECAAVLTGHEGTVWCSDFSKEEHPIRICSGSDDSTVRVWKYIGDDEDDQQEWVCESVLPAVHKRQVYGVSWGTNGLIASVGADGVLAIYKETQTEDGNSTWEVVAKHSTSHGVYEINTVKWSTIDGKDMLLTAGDDGRVNLWDIQV